MLPFPCLSRASLYASIPAIWLPVSGTHTFMPFTFACLLLKLKRSSNSLSSFSLPTWLLPFVLLFCYLASLVAFVLAFILLAFWMPTLHQLPPCVLSFVLAWILAPSLPVFVLLSLHDIMHFSCMLASFLTFLLGFVIPFCFQSRLVPFLLP